MRNIYYETISNIINDNLNFELISSGINTDDINFVIVTLSVFKNFIVYPYKDAMKIIGMQKAGLFNSIEKNELKKIWSKVMLQEILEGQEINREDKWLVDQIVKSLNNENELYSVHDILLKDDIDRIILKLKKIFNNSIIRTISVNDGILIILDFDVFLLNENELNNFSNLLREEKLIKEFSIMPNYNWEDENDENAVAIKMLINLKGEEINEN